MAGQRRRVISRSMSYPVSTLAHGGPSTGYVVSTPAYSGPFEVLLQLILREQVEIYDCTNGNRLTTYVIEGERGAGEVVLNGAAAHKASADDLVIICSYADYEADELATHEPTVIFVDEKNRIIDKDTAVRAGQGPLPVPVAI